MGLDCCKNCGAHIEDRGHPYIQVDSNWYSNWVHVPGGYSMCYPQLGGDSPRATPDDHDPDCECGGWPQG